MDASTVRLKEQATALGLSALGVAQAQSPPHLDAYRDWLQRGFHGSMDYLARHVPMKEHPKTLLSGARSVLAVSLNYNQPNAPTQGRPRIARYALGRDYHKVLRSKLKRLSAWIETEHPGSQCRPCVDSAPILERDFAQLAGLGWFGKNTMLIDSRRGSWFFIGLLLTTVEFQSDVPAVGGCGTCRKCIDACPTGALVFEGNRWQLDARRCISYLTIEHRGEFTAEQADWIGDWTFGCDVCQEVCPFNEARSGQPERAKPTTEPDFKPASELPPLPHLASLERREWDALTRGRALRRAGLEGLTRNAKANMANSNPIPPADST